MADTLLEVEVVELEMQDPTAKRAHSSNSKHPVASIWQSISNTDSSSFKRDLVGSVDVDTKFVKTEDEIRGCLRDKVENVRRGHYVARELHSENLICKHL